MTNTIVLNDDQWYEQYGLEGAMFETYGKDMEYINSIPDAYVWTMVDGDEDSVVVNGKAFVNRLGYFVSKRPHNPDDIIVVEFDAR